MTKIDLPGFHLTEPDAPQRCGTCRNIYHLHDRKSVYQGAWCFKSVEEDVQRFTDWRRQLQEEGQRVAENNTCGNWVARTKFNE